MKKGLKRGLAAALCVCLSFSALTGCAKKKEQDSTAAMLSIKDGETMSVGAASVLLRYRQAEFENGFGQFIKSYYGDIWNADLGSGEPYGNTFKEQILTEMQHMLLAKTHAADFDIAVTDDEKTGIENAVESFMAENDAEVLEKIGANEDSVREMLTNLTLTTRMETAMGADVDTEVSDEEAAQRTVSYVYFNAETEAADEEETETDLLEELSESVEEAAGVAEEASEMVSEAAQASVEAESEVKTQTADTAETVTEAATEAADEAVAEEAAEAVTEAETETETEPESPEMVAARIAAMARAEAFLEDVQNGADFTTAAQEAQSDESMHAYTSTYTFGEDDTYPAEEIREATKGLEDGTIVDHVVMVGTSYYVLRVDDAFDEAATEQKKTDIVEQRRADAVSALYEEWSTDIQYELNSEAWTALIFDVALNYPQEAETESLSEAETDLSGEGVAESATEP